MNSGEAALPVLWKSIRWQCVLVLNQMVGILIHYRGGHAGVESSDSMNMRGVFHLSVLKGLPGVNHLPVLNSLPGVNNLSVLNNVSGVKVSVLNDVPVW